MFTLAQPAYHRYNPYEELAMQQELQHRRQVEAYLPRQREAEEIERRRHEYAAAVRAEYERRQQAELQRRRQAELQRRRQAHQARGRHSMYDGGLESLFDALYGGQSSHQARPWSHTHEEHQPNPTARKSPTPTPPTPSRDPASTPVPVSTPAPVPTTTEPEIEEPQVDTAPSYAAIQSVLSSLTALQSEFTFPTRLDFQPGSSKLAYTSNNAPLHGYEHALTGLLTRLDAVESYGDDGVRRARKEAVKTIEQELERLDGMKAEAWKRINEPEPQVVKLSDESEVDPTSVPLPEDEDEDMEGGSQTIAPQSQSEEPWASADYDPTEPTLPSKAEQSAPPEQTIDTDPALTSAQSPFDTEHAVSDDVVSTPEPLAHSLTSPSHSEVSNSDSYSGLELEEYIDVETSSMSEDEGTDLEEVEKDGDLELMNACEHALTGLLNQLDAVESHGSDEVWRIQKEVVKTIKREWKRPDGMKAEAWKRTNEPEPETAKSSAESEVDPTSVTFTEKEDEKMEHGLQATVCG
ncbi:hypothetical protein RSOLAG22IIIB_09618 [Rhizoctonia solani]|uniref:BAG domain-containing protein n=1 Tax=Rhizoctonia solani TaxID=456999 RepID=A0A0K6FYZ4_9AGAM|nr:hypothetical protein RSOLAG22IIIB_09618 [Rhizoctonia solani]